MAPKPAKPAPEGVLFPKTDASGDRSTQVTGKNAFAAALAAVDATLGDRAKNERSWRYGYTKHVVNHVVKSANSREDALKIANAGLDFMHNNFEFVRDGTTTSMQEAMDTVKETFHSGFVKGKVPKPSKFELEIPYKDRVLKGGEIARQVDKWVSCGTIEPSAGEYIKAVANNPEWLDLSDKYFVLLGAGSAMGPFLTLMKLGANVIAIDLNRPNIWKRLISIAEESCGTLTFPLACDPKEADGELLYEKAGCNLFTQTPEIKNWICEVCPGKDLVIGSYAYLDGEAHVRVALAMDAICKGVCAARPTTALAYLNTPTQAFLIPEEAAKSSLARYNKLSLFNLVLTPFRLFGGRRFCSKNMQIQAPTTDGRKEPVVNALVVAQGPNYALAKCIQHWRAVVERDAGHLVSSNIAPSTATASVVHNRSFAWAYGGMYYFEPMEIFGQETSNAVMATLLINDVRNERANACPKKTLRNPWDLFKDGSFHGGVWRIAYTMDSIGELSALLYFWDKAKPLVLVSVIVALVAIYAF